MKIKSTLTLAALMACGASANAAAIIYEPFSQTAGDLNGKASSGIGLSGNWTDSQVVTVVTPTTLSYGNLSNSDNEINMPNGNGTWASVSTTTALATDGLLNSGGTLWFSYVFQKSSHGGSNEHSGFAFGTDRVNPAYNGLNMQNSGYGFGAYTNGSSVTASSWSSGSRNGGSASDLQDSTPGTPANDGFAATFVIGKIVWGAASGTTAETNETMTLYTRTLNDIVTEPTTGGGMRVTAAFDQTALNTISFGQRNSGGTQFYDEIRFGATYADVALAVPEPTAALLGAIGSLILLRRRRWANAIP
jgi:hypothetical protein